MSERATCGFTRRNFIKGAAVLGAAGALVGCSPKADDKEAAQPVAAESPDEIYAGACRAQCLNGCFLNVHVRDGQVVRTTARDFPDTKWNRICPKGITTVARMYSSERLQYPMRRVGDRGTGEFERISWDEAMAEIAEKWGGYISEYGPESIAYFLGSGNQAVCGSGGTPGSGMARLRQVTGASEIRPDRDIAFSSRLSHVFGYGGWMYGNSPADLVNAKTIVNWAAYPAVSQKQTMHFILDAKDNGAKLVDVNICYNTMSAMSDWFVSVSPATDGALALGAICEVLDQGWQDVEFLQNCTEAPLLIKEDGAYLRMSDLGVEPTKTTNAMGKEVVVDPYAVWDEQVGAAVSLDEAAKPAMEGVAEVEGISCKTVYDFIKEEISNWSVEKASEVTGVSPEDIRELARIYAQDGPVYTYVQYGIDHYNNGIYNYGPIFALMLLTGNSGKSGAGAGMSLAGPEVSNSAGVLAMPDSQGNPPQGGGRAINWSALFPLIDTGMLNGEPFTLKSVYISCSNPLTCQSEHRETVRLFNALDFVVVQDMTLTDTALYADILLPACHWFETVDLCCRYIQNPYLILQEQCAEPLYESKPDFEIYRLIAQSLGYGDYFTMSAEEYIEAWLDSDAARSIGATYDVLMNEKVIRVKPEGSEVAFEGGVYGTDSKRARFYRETIVPEHSLAASVDESKEHSMLYWEPALEADLGSPIREKYPFSVCNEYMRTRTHSQWWDVGYLKEFEAQPIVRINPDDAASLGIGEGDVVKLSNDRGFAVLTATLNAGQQPGTVHCNRSFQEREFIDGNTADLTFNDYNQVTANQAYNDCAVAIEKM